MNIALVGEQMPCLAQVCGGAQGGFKVLACFSGQTFRKCLPAERQVGAHVLAQWATFSSFPRLEASGFDERRGFFVTPGLVVERAELNG